VPSQPLLLMTPGPTRMPDRVLQAGARPMIHHRSPEFSRALGAMLESLQPVFGTAGTVLPVHTTGRGAMEAAVCNLFSPGDELLACCNGKFGEMWATLAESYGLVVHRIETDWNQSVSAERVEEALERHPGVRAILLAWCDTTNGVRNDVASVVRAARRRNCLVLVDGVSAIGGMRFLADEWEVDLAVTASQKCLMSSPGLAFVTVSERAWKATRTARLPRNYWNFRDIQEYVTRSKPETPGTPPVHIVLQVSEALTMMHEESLDRVFRRHEEMAAITRRRIVEMGLELQCPDLDDYSATVTAIGLPDGVPPRALRDGLKARGILTAAGLGHFEPCGFRIGHMGDIRIADVERTLGALAEVLRSRIAA
jgi:aspartate aminotransferase-like enzyme